MTTFTVTDIDIVYLSYDEPNAEANWAHLRNICPWAQRVHGIKGSDRAHKACADITEGTHMITVDGDNQINPKFFNQTWSFDSSWNVDSSVLSFSSLNVINGLTYGNGGIKLWPRHVVHAMQTHEAVSSGSAAVDFCWHLDYVLMPGIWSTSLINHTPHQAWRAGFREGVKMALVNGQLIKNPAEWRSSMAKVNWDRLTVWLQVGLDQHNAAWAIMGARQGLHRAMLTDWDHSQVQSFDHLDHIWHEEVRDLADPQGYIRDLGVELRNRLGMAIEPEPLTPAQSKWFKSVFHQPERVEPRRLRP
jgi:hypothetical protein